MKKFLILMLMLIPVSGVYAGTPAETFMEGYDGVRGAKNISVKGSMMVFARPVIKKYPIGPMADVVEEVSVLNMGKASESDKMSFLDSLASMLDSNYRYYGKSDSPNGPVDVYVHLADNETADELVIYNPELFVLNSLIGDFSVEELLKLGGRNGK